MTNVYLFTSRRFLLTGYGCVTYEHLHGAFIRNVFSGETLDCVPLLETLDLSWNTGIGAGNLHFLTDHLHSTGTLRELHLLDCQLSETDSVALGENQPTEENLQHGAETIAA